MNKFFSCLIIAFILCAPLYAQSMPDESTSTVPDSSFVFRYPACIQMFKADYKSNRQTLQKLRHSLQTFTKGKDTLYVNGYSGECDPSQRNRQTAYYRCNNLKGYLINYYGLRERDFKTVNAPHNHPELGDIVMISFSPTGSTAKVKEAIPETMVENETTPPVDTPVVEPEQEQPTPVKETEKKPVTEQADTPPDDTAYVQMRQTPSDIVLQAQSPLSRWYIGGGAGIAFGRGTLCSFAADGTHPGWNVGLLGGYRINRLLSAEVSLDYTRLSLGAYDCCGNLWLGADGNRYYAPVAGMDSYSYKELRSTSNLVSLGAHLNVDLVSIWKEDSRWSALVIPAIYAVYSSAKVKQGAVEANKTSGLHFGLGADLGVQYMITPQWGVRLTTGIDYITGKPIDAMPRTEHKSNYVWNTGLKVIFKLK